MDNVGYHDKLQVPSSSETAVLKATNILTTLVIDENPPGDEFGQWLLVYQRRGHVGG